MLDPPLTENDPGPLNTTVRTLLLEKREGERESARVCMCVRVRVEGNSESLVVT